MRQEQLVNDYIGLVEGIYAFIYTDALTHRQTLKDRATQLLIKHKSGALVTQSRDEQTILLWQDPR